MNNLTSELAFATPIFRLAVTNGKALAADLEAEIYRQREQGKGVRMSTNSAWHSGKKFLSGIQPCIEKLRQQILAVLTEIGKQGAPELISGKLNLRLRGWANVSPKGGYHFPHQHGGNHWSGVFYVRQPAVAAGDSGSIEFLDPRPDLAHWRHLDSPWFAQKLKFRPEAGEMLVFPSYLMHWVYLNESEEDRISIAWNAFFGRPEG